MEAVQKSKCPFCKRIVEHYNLCNGFCLCGAKYYSEDRVWLNRKTGEEVKEESE